MMKRIRGRRTARRLLIAAAVIATLAPAAATAQPVAETRITPEIIKWAPIIEYEALALSVSGPGVQLDREFPAGKAPFLRIVPQKGAERLPDGTYAYELRARLPLDEETREKAARNPGLRGLEPPQPGGRPATQSGYFTVTKGLFVTEGEGEPEPPPERERPAQVIEGDVRIKGNLEVEGKKSFVAVDPTDPDRLLVYAALEGPEAGTYLRGTAVTAGGEAVVELPEHFAKVTEADGLTVQLTPLGGWSRLYVAEKSPRRLVVRDAAGRDGIRFDYLIQGVRRGHADHRVERPDGDR